MGCADSRDALDAPRGAPKQKPHSPEAELQLRYEAQLRRKDEAACRRRGSSRRSTMGSRTASQTTTACSSQLLTRAGSASASCGFVLITPADTPTGASASGRRVIFSVPPFSAP